MRLPFPSKSPQPDRVSDRNPTAFFPAAVQRGRASGILTSPLKNRVWNFCRRPSGRTSSRRPSRRGTAPGYRACSYETASGRPYWPSRDPSEERGGVNIYNFIRNDSISAFDYLGLERLIGNVDFDAFSGHHLVSYELVRDYGFSEEAAEIFAKATVPADNHSFLSHGRSTGYTANVEQELQHEMKRIFGDKCALSIDEQKRFANEFVNKIRDSKNPMIKGFLDRVNNKTELRRWADAMKGKFPVPSIGPIQKLSIRSLPMPSGAKKLARRIPGVGKVAGYVVAAGTGAIMYNNLRADGYTRTEATIFSVHDSLTPLPFGAIEVADGIWYSEEVLKKAGMAAEQETKSFLDDFWDFFGRDWCPCYSPTNDRSRGPKDN